MNSLKTSTLTLLLAAVSLGPAITAASITVSVLMSLTQTPPSRVTFAISPGTSLVVSHDLAGGASPSGYGLEPGSVLSLSHKTLELSFASGVRGIVRGPAKLTVLREDLLDLSSGTAWFQVPRGAEGFQVRTPDLVLTDLGTEFGLISKTDTLDEVHVFKGMVSVLNRYELKLEQELTQGEARVAVRAGSWNEITLRLDPFLTELPIGELLPVVLEGTATFTTSPSDEMVKKQRYIFRAKETFAGFSPAKADKLVATLSHEHGRISDVIYGGVRMDLAVQTATSDTQQTSIFFLDAPDKAGDLVIVFEGVANGVGGSLLALLNTAPGGPVLTEIANASSVRLSDSPAYACVVATHACNSTSGGSTALDASTPFAKVFRGPTGSNIGGSGYWISTHPGSATVSFSGTNIRPVTAAAVFEPIR